MILKLESLAAGTFTVTRVVTSQDNTYQKGEYRPVVLGDRVGFDEIGNGVQVVYPTLFSDWQDETDTPYPTLQALLDDIKAKCFAVPNGGSGGGNFWKSDGNTDLLANNIINQDANQVSIRSNNTNTRFSITQDNTVLELLYNLTGAPQGIFQITPANISLGWGGASLLRYQSSGIATFFDTIGSFGAKYGADYEAAGILDPLWIPHYQAVLNAIPAFLDYTNTSGAPFSTTSTTFQLVFTHNFNAEPSQTVRLDIVWLFEIDSSNQAAEFDIRVNGNSEFIASEEASDTDEVNIITIPATLGVTQGSIPLLSGNNTIELYARKVSGGALLSIPQSGAITERKR